jgi:hypothetical protein
VYNCVIWKWHIGSFTSLTFARSNCLTLLLTFSANVDVKDTILDNCLESVCNICKLGLKFSNNFSPLTSCYQNHVSCQPSACNINVLSVICSLHNLRSPFRIPYYLVRPIVFSFRAKAFFYSGTIRRFSWNGTTVSHWRFHDNRRMKTSADVLNTKFHHFRVKCWILLKPVLGGLDGNLHFPVPSMKRLNQTEPATFSILLCWTFFKDSVFLYFIMKKS